MNLPGAMNTEEMDEFLDRVNAVNKQVKDIVHGKVDLEKLDRDESERETIEKGKVEVKKREYREWQLKGRPGKGH